jgi:hypothetical protein
MSDPHRVSARVEPRFEFVEDAGPHRALMSEPDEYQNHGRKPPLGSPCTVSVWPETAGITSMCYTSPPRKRGSRAAAEALGSWIPAFAGMTNNRLILLDSFLASLSRGLPA